jgi:ABC-type Mn2+/Zn2+ transport system permease subunit
MSWLFAQAWLTGVLLAALLPLLGVVLLLRQQVFLGAAIAQSANLGIAVALAAGLGTAAGAGHRLEAAAPLLSGLLFSAATCAFAMRALSAGESSHEARAAFVFLFASSAALLLLSGSPHGSHEVQRLMLSSLLGANALDVVVSALLLAATVAAALLWPRRVLLWATDPASARAYGYRVGAIDVAAGAWIGGAIGFAIHGTGMPFTFGCTVLPVLFAREVATSLRAVLVLAPLVGAAAFALAWWIGDRLDLPPGQCVVVVLALLAAMARAVRRR